MTIAGLIRIEWLKARRRTGFWVASLFFFVVIALGTGMEYWRHVRKPEQWSGQSGWAGLGGGVQGIGFMIVLILVVLLTASEKTWRTERQNVIDGLSRDQYFFGKVLLLLGIVLFFWAGSVLIGGIFEALHFTLPTVADRPFITGDELIRLGALIVYLLLVGAIALFFGTVASSSGAALALAVVLMIAQAPLAFLIAQEGGFWQDLTAWLPFQLLASLGGAGFSEQFDELQAMTRSGGMPQMLRAGPAALVALSYSILLAGGAWLSLRTRDL